MSMFSIFNVSGSAISAQSQRLNVVASNLANVDAVAGPDGQAYKARQVVFQTTPMGSDGAAGVRVTGIQESDTPGRRVHGRGMHVVASPSRAPPPRSCGSRTPPPPAARRRPGRRCPATRRWPPRRPGC